VRSQTIQQDKHELILNQIQSKRLKRPANKFEKNEGFSAGTVVAISRGGGKAISGCPAGRGSVGCEGTGSGAGDNTIGVTGGAGGEIGEDGASGWGED